MFDMAKKKIGRRDRIRTCMGFRPRVSETRVYPLHHSPKKELPAVAKATARQPSHEAGLPSRSSNERRLVPTAGIAPALSTFSTLRLFSWATPAKKLEHPQGRAPRCLSYQDSPSLSTGWMQKMVEAEGLAPSQPVRASRLQRAAFAALPRFEKNGGSSRSCTCDLLLMRELRSLLRHRAKSGLPGRSSRPWT